MTKENVDQLKLSLQDLLQKDQEAACAAERFNDDYFPVILLPKKSFLKKSNFFFRMLIKKQTFGRYYGFRLPIEFGSIVKDIDDLN